MSRNVFQKSSDDNEQPQGIAIGIERGNGALPYIGILAKILEKISPRQPNKEDEAESVKVALSSLGLVLQRNPEAYNRLIAFLGVHASAFMDDKDINLEDAPDGFIEMREKFKDALLDEAKDKAKSESEQE